MLWSHPTRQENTPGMVITMLCSSRLSFWWIASLLCCFGAGHADLQALSASIILSQGELGVEGGPGCSQNPSGLGCSSSKGGKAGTQLLGTQSYPGLPLLLCFQSAKDKHIGLAWASAVLYILKVRVEVSYFFHRFWGSSCVVWKK